MDFQYGNSGFMPYESFDKIYSSRKLPEFGNPDSPYVREISTWSFFLANNEGEIPFGFEGSGFDDSDWDLINVPSTWQTEGYGLPQDLLYNYPEELEKISKRGEESVSDKYLIHSTHSDDDEVGIYRTTVVFSPEDIDRALYLEVSGVCGSFEVYLNGQLQTKSHSILTHKKLLISGSSKPGVNTIAILVRRWDRDRHGHILKGIMNHGFSGIFRPIHIVAEPLLELSHLRIKTEKVPAAYVEQINEVATTKGQTTTKITRDDYLVDVSFDVTNHTDFIMPYNVKISVMEARSEYDPYKLPLANLNMQQNPGGVVESLTTNPDKATFVALNVAEWTDATPIQYDLIIELLDSEQRTIGVKKRRFGFRTTTITNGKFSINDTPIPLNLVKYYEFDPKSGITVPRDVYRHDIILMKRGGINGVISQGFPLNEEFLDLCDQYGLYVIASADKSLIADYVETVMNHPSVIMWGMSSYEYDPKHCVKIKAYCNKIDGTRPWYCSVDYDMQVSDVYPMPSETGVVYGPWQDLCLDRKTIFEKNKVGRNLFETIPGRSHFQDDSADYKWIHHADLVGGKSKENSCIGQGVVDSERKPHPIYHDVKKQCQNISIYSSPEDPFALTLRNQHPFAYTDEMNLEWKLLIGGTAVMQGKGSLPEIEPYGVRNLRFPVDVDRFMMPGWGEGNANIEAMYNNSLSHEIVFDVTLKLASNTYYANEGYEMAFYQDVIADECANPKLTYKTVGLLESGEDDVETALALGDVVEEILPEESKEVNVVAMPDSINVGGINYKIMFDRRTGAISGINVGGREFLKGSIVPSFYRCPSNIDRTDRSFVLAKTIFSKETDYEDIQNSLDFSGCSYGVKDGVVSILSKYKSFAMKGDILVLYEIPTKDTLKVTLKFTPKYDMVRYGIRVPVSKDGILCSWYGRGPGESYYDRKNATKIGFYAAGTDKIYHSYARPAENSSHTDTAAMKLSDEMNNTIRVEREGKGTKFDFTILPYTPEQMNSSLHEEVLMNNDSCELFLDFCSKEIERTDTNVSALPLKKNVEYKDTFVLKLTSGQ
ncbi:MAG: DUF4981 domain-containing protein [Saccharofermentans sp.]|nr:DUF4981 domain-containing protein [Saccharofermentans sp.]